jgi:hypothetical protein
MGCSWYHFKSATGYGVPVTWQDIATAYEAATGNNVEEDEKVKLSSLEEWILTKTSEVEGLKIYDVGHFYAFFTLRGLFDTGGDCLSVPCDTEIIFDAKLVSLNQIQNLPGYAEDDQLLESIARQVTPSGERLGFPTGSWIATNGSYENIRLLENKAKGTSVKVTAKKAKTDSDDKCLFIVGAEKKEISWNRNVLAESNPTLKNILFGTGQLKPDPSKPVEWPEYMPNSVELIFKALPFVEKKNLVGNTKPKVVPDGVYNSCKLLADYLGIDFYRLSLASDRFKDPTIKEYKDEEEDDE